MSVMVYSLAFIALWWLFSATLFIGVLYVLDRDEATKFLDDLRRWWRL